MFRSFMLLPVLAISLFSSCMYEQGSRGNGGSVTNEDPLDPPIAEDNVDGIQWKLVADNNWIFTGDNEAYLYLELKTGNAKDQQKRVPLNVSLVLDRSGSMAGEKIAYAKRAAGFVVDQLNEGDYISIVNYDDQVEVTYPSQKVQNKAALKQKIDKLYDRNGTNLTAGMLQGYDQVQSTKREGYVNRVLLLTDGLANEGITDPQQIKKLVHDRYTERGIALSTFGLGADYNEDLLTLLAETGHANYYYIDKADKIPEIFAKELKGLLNVVAQNAVATIDLPPGMTCEKVYGYPYEVKNGKIEVRFNDLYANDEKAILIKLRKTRGEASSYKFAAWLSYTDANSFRNIQEDKAAMVKITSDEQLVAKNKNAKVQEMMALFEATERFDEVLKDVDKGDYAAAKQKAAKAVTILKETQHTYKSEKLKAQETQMASYAESVDNVSQMKDEEKSMYQKSNKEANYRTKKMK